MKKSLAIVLAFAMMLCLLAGCGTQAGNGDDTPSQNVEDTADNTEPESQVPEEKEEEPADVPAEEEPAAPVEENPVEDTPAFEGAVPTGTYIYDETTPFGSIPWNLTLNDDGTFEIKQDNEQMGNPVWTGEKYIDNGDGTVTTPDCVGDGPQIASFWEGNNIEWTILGDNHAVPTKSADLVTATDTYGPLTAGNSGAAAAGGDLAGEYTFMETTPFGEIPWSVTLNADGTFEIKQDNEQMGNPTWTGEQWVDNGDGTVTTPDCVGDGPQIATFWRNNSITFTVNGDGTITPVE